MRRKLHFYHEPSARNTCNVVAYKKAMPVYPKAIRFCITKYMDAYAYMQGIAEFIQSTKIPESCKKCPIYDTAFMCNGHCGTVMCHLAWRKIWEYVK